MTDQPRRPAFAPLDQPRSLTAALSARLTEEITSGRLAPGQQLPTETEMIAAFGVSRTVVREAIAALKAEGLVEARQGAGVFVAPNPQRPFRIDPAGIRCVGDVLELMELRLAVEIEAAGLAAERRTTVGLREIERTLRHFERARRAGADAVEADYAFHCAIGAATGNDFFLSFLRYLGSFIIPRRSIQILSDEGEEKAAYLGGVLDEHRAIAEAIRDRDRAAAREAMRLHLERGRDRYRSIDPRMPVS